MTPQHFFIGTRYLGSREVPNFIKSSFGPRPVYSVCWFCPRCADIWSRLIVEDSSYAQVWSRACLKHGDGRIDSECRFEWWPCELDATWPDEALRYVLLTELKLYEQGT